LHFPKQFPPFVISSFQFSKKKEKDKVYYMGVHRTLCCHRMVFFEYFFKKIEATLVYKKSSIRVDGA